MEILLLDLEIAVVRLEKSKNSIKGEFRELNPLLKMRRNSLIMSNFFPLDFFFKFLGPLQRWALGRRTSGLPSGPGLLKVGGSIPTKGILGESFPLLSPQFQSVCRQI